MDDIIRAYKLLKKNKPPEYKVFLAYQVAEHGIIHDLTTNLQAATERVIDAQKQGMESHMNYVYVVATNEEEVRQDTYSGTIFTIPQYDNAIACAKEMTAISMQDWLMKFYKTIELGLEIYIGNNKAESETGPKEDSGWCKM